jgi:hypothetical protein
VEAIAHQVRQSKSQFLNLKGACNACPCGTTSNYVGEGTFAGYLSSVGLDQSVFLCIAQAESSLNANAMNQNGANMAVGVLQVNDNNGKKLKLIKA